MDLTYRLARLERRLQWRRRAQARANETWQFRYKWWPIDGWDKIPPPTEPLLTLEEFKAVWRQVHGPTPRR